MNAVELEDLRYAYPARRRSEQPFQALRGITFSVAEREIFGLLGPNGGGKTTTFQILSTFFRPDQGRAAIFGSDVTREPEKVRRRLGVVFQNPGLDRKLSVRENLWHQGHLYGLWGAWLGKRIDEVLNRLALQDRAGARVETLSGGLRRRAEVAKGLLHRPALLLLDEPSTGLDPGARRDLWDYLRELRQKEGMTIVLTTHLMEEAEQCDRVAILNRGERVALGTPEALKQEVGGEVVTVETAKPEDLAQRIRDKFQATAAVVDGLLRIERSGGAAFIPQLVGAFPGAIRSVTLGQPTLEDVFIRHTGHRFWSSEEKTDA